MHLPVGWTGELRSSALESGHLEKQNTKPALIIEPASEAKGTPYWVWYMNEGGHYMAVHLVFPACVVALSFSFVLCCPLKLCFQASLQRQKSNWTQPNCPWAACYNIFPIATRQTTPGCSPLAPLWSLLPSALLHLSSSHGLTEACCLRPAGTSGTSLCSLVCVLFPCSAAEGFFSACLLYPPAGSQPWLALLPMPLAGEMQVLQPCRPSWCHKPPALPPATLTLMQQAHTRDVSSLSLLCTLLALVSPSDHWIWFWRDSECLLAMDNIVFFMLFYFIKELALELQCDPLSQPSIFA